MVTSVSTRFGVGVWLVAAAGLFGAARGVSTQVDSRDSPVVAQPQQRFDAGQDIQPIFEGWARAADGSYLLHFGYLNRNYREQPNIPVGPDNHFSPGNADRGQPTYFYPRTHRYQFAVRAPASMGTSFADALVWTVTRHGSVQTAAGWLQPEWEIDANTITANSGTSRGHSKADIYANEPPSVTLKSSVSSVPVGQPLLLTAVLGDDDLPVELPPRKRTQPIPALTRPEGFPATPDNIRWYRRPRPPRNGLSVLWVVYRGPADTTFEPSGYQRSVLEKGGDDARGSSRLGATATGASDVTMTEGDGWTSATFETTVTFDAPGTYTLRAVASDAVISTAADLVITVTR